ncbi:hypothetical protein [Nocardioides sp. LHG3406-4]
MSPLGHPPHPPVTAARPPLNLEQVREIAESPTRQHWTPPGAD